MIRPILAACVLLLAAASPLQAQFTEGQRIRVAAPSEGVYSPSAGTVMQVLPDSVVVDIRGVQHTLSHRGITQLQVSRGKVHDFNSTRNSVGMGLAAGYMVGWLHHKIAAEGEDGYLAPEERRDRRPLFALAGGIAGALIVSYRPNDEWQTVPLEVAAGADPQTGSALLGFTFRF